MAWQIDLSRFFNWETVGPRIQNIPPLITPIMDKIYPPARRVNHPFAFVGADIWKKLFKNMPLVERGAPALPLVQGRRDISFIEPRGIDLSDFIQGKDLADLQSLTGIRLEMWRDQKLQEMLYATQRTTEALCTQAITGKIDYALKVEGGYDHYVVDFTNDGALGPLSFEPASLWDDPNTKLSHIIKDLIAITRLIYENGYGNMFKYYIGSETYTALVDKLTPIFSTMGASGEVIVTGSITENGIRIGGYFLEYVVARYWDYFSNTWVDAIPSNGITVIAQDAPWWLYYCMIDDLKAGPEPLPFWTNSILQDDPSGLKLISKSKPLPISIPGAVCNAIVTAPTSPP
jgi:hypothetical protein